MSCAWRNIVASLLVLAGSTIVLAEPLDQARRRADAARRDYAVADNNLRNITGNLTQRSVRSAIWSGARARCRERSPTPPTAPASSTLTPTPPSRKLPTIKADVSKAEAEHTQQLAAANASKATMTKSAADVDKAKADATAAFQATPA